MTNNSRSNSIIKWMIVAGDFVLLNAIILAVTTLSWRVNNWPNRSLEIFILVNNIAMILAVSRYAPIVHQRVIGAGDVLQRIIGLTMMQTVLAYVLLKVFDYNLPIGWIQLWIGTAFFVALLVKRLCERWFIKLYRQAGRNTRAATLVGNDPELINLYEKLSKDTTLGYRIRGYYADAEMGEWTHSIEEGSEKPDAGKMKDDGSSAFNPQFSVLKHLGTVQDLLRMMNEEPEKMELGDEMYVCLSRRDKDIIKRISRFCDYKVVRFFYVPTSVESIGLNLKREFVDDMELFTTYETPLQNPINKLKKRAMDIILSTLCLIPTAIIFPFVWLIIKIQSPGPLFFKQDRTGLDGKNFKMIKFRSMHVNKDADKIQATKDDPRKYPFGNFMRKANIDELPQFWNVLMGDMSIVGPRPHMLAHTEMYSQLIDKYMVRHFVKPGITGWAQVTGYRGETKELWQMEGRVRRDIWYMEHWSVWLDVRIIWLTFKTFFIHDKNAY